jgi:hypothetical protein
MCLCGVLLREKMVFYHTDIEMYASIQDCSNEALGRRVYCFFLLGGGCVGRERHWSQTPLTLLSLKEGLRARVWSYTYTSVVKMHIYKRTGRSSPPME